VNALRDALWRHPGPLPASMDRPRHQARRRMRVRGDTARRCFGVRHGLATSGLLSRISLRSSGLPANRQDSASQSNSPQTTRLDAFAPTNGQLRAGDQTSIRARARHHAPGASVALAAGSALASRKHLRLPAPTRLSCRSEHRRSHASSKREPGCASRMLHCAERAHGCRPNPCSGTEKKRRWQLLANARREAAFIKCREPDLAAVR
jgi:hypothetical protein